MLKNIIAIILALIVASCAGVPSKPVTVCQDVPGESLIEQRIPDLAAADMLLKISVLEIGRLDKVRQNDVARVLDEAEALLDAGTTYDGLIAFLLPKIKWLKENAGAEVVIIGEYFIAFQGVALPIKPKDKCYLKSAVQSLRAKVLPWII